MIAMCRDTYSFGLALWDASRSTGESDPRLPEQASGALHMESRNPQTVLLRCVQNSVISHSDTVQRNRVIVWNAVNGKVKMLNHVI